MIRRGPVFDQMLMPIRSFRDTLRISCQNQKLESHMFSWAVIFFVIAIIAGVLGFSGIAGAAAGIAKILFFIFLVIFVILLITGRRPRV